MISILDSDYRQSCRSIIHAAIQRPEMMYNKLSDLAFTMHGHWLAFEELGSIDRKNSFNYSFCDWIETTNHVSCSMGWASACDSASTCDSPPSDIFAKWASVFLDQWIDSSTSE